MNQRMQGTGRSFSDSPPPVSAVLIDSLTCLLQVDRTSQRLSSKTGGLGASACPI